jgi:hypothetical protein
MRRITAAAVLAIAGFASAGQALAWNQAVLANVPFAFTAGNKQLPSGTYLITPESSGAIRVQSSDLSVRIFVAATQSQANATTGSKLVFHKYGDRYFLNEVVGPESGFNAQVPVSKSERLEGSPKR